MEKQLLEQYINEGLSSHQIAQKTNKSQSTIRYWLNKYNLKTKHYSFQSKDHQFNTTIIDGKKICAKCKEQKIIDNFYGKNNKRLYSYCKNCVRITTVERLKNYKLKAINYLGGKCIVCGYNKYYGALDFHHLNSSTKDFNIGESSMSFASLKSELDKCIILCKNCHAELHAGLITL